MKKMLTLLAIVAIGATAFGDAGYWDDFAIVNTTSDTYYDLGATTGNTDFDGADLGTFDSGTDNLQLGGQVKTWYNSPSDVTGASINYRIWSGTEGGTFDTLAYNWKQNLGGNDNEWGTDTGTPYYSGNLLSGLANGTYTLEVFTTIDTNGNGTPNPILADNGGANYEATFAVIPEPATLGIMAVVGAAGLFVRRFFMV